MASPGGTQPRPRDCPQIVVRFRTPDGRVHTLSGKDKVKEFERRKEEETKKLKAELAIKNLQVGAWGREAVPRNGPLVQSGTTHTGSSYEAFTRETQCVECISFTNSAPCHFVSICILQSASAPASPNIHAKQNACGSRASLRDHRMDSRNKQLSGLRQPAG